MEYIIVICLLVIIFLLWRNSEEVISSSSNDWLIILWKDEGINGKICIDFLPIIGWRYRKHINSFGRYEPVTPFYGKKYRTDNTKIVSYYWIRDGNVYNFTDDVRSWERSFWEDLNDYVWNDMKIKLVSNIPDSLQKRYNEIVEKKVPLHFTNEQED